MAKHEDQNGNGPSALNAEATEEKTDSETSSNMTEKEQGRHTALDRLRQRRQWVCWKFIEPKDPEKNDKPVKVPVNPHTGKNAQTNNPQTWGTYEQALHYARRFVDPVDWAKYRDGKYAEMIARAKAQPMVGYVLTEDDDLSGGDLDKVRDPITGVIEPWAQVIVDLAETYCEISPSGTGLRFFWHGKVPRAYKNDAAQVEVYGDGRYLTFTGLRLPTSPDEIRAAPRTLAALIARYEEFKAKAKAKAAKSSKKKESSKKKKSGSGSSVDDAAMQNFDAWVPELLPGIAEKQSNGGYRVRSSDLGRPDLEEDLSINPEGIVWFGVADMGDEREGKRTPTELVAQFLHGGVSYESAMAWLCEKLGIEVPNILDPSDPYPSARKLIEKRFTDKQGRVLIHRYREEFWLFDGTCYVAIDEETVDAAIGRFLDKAKRYDPITDRIVRFKPDTAKVTNVREAMQALTMLSQRITVPAWLGGGDHPPADEFFVCANGMLHLPTLKMYEPTPDFFNVTASTVRYDPDAPPPERWLQYLNEVIGDEQSINALQEWMGYTLTPDTSQQKVLLCVGDKRSGKGTYARIHRKLLSETAVPAPTLSALGEQFGRMELIGKPLAIISDARIGSRTDKAAVIETLLSISGEDGVTVPRKFLSAWTGKLSIRFAILTNDLPSLPDPSGAFASRLIVILFPECFLGREDHQLTNKLTAELSSILNWAIIGYQRLRARGRFVQPERSKVLSAQIDTLGAPVKAFLEDQCVMGPTCEVDRDDLYSAWKNWCSGEGIKEPNTKEWFGRNLRSALPKILTIKRGSVGNQRRVYVGVGLATPFPF